MGLRVRQIGAQTCLPPGVQPVPQIVRFRSQWGDYSARAHRRQITLGPDHRWLLELLGSLWYDEPKMIEGFEEIEHTSDIALRAWGNDLGELFANAALGMTHLIAGSGEVTCSIEHRVELAEYDAETLLVAWLGELLYLNERKGVVFAGFEMEEVTSTRLRALVRGGPPRELTRHIKAVTFSGLGILRNCDGFEVTVVFDV